MAKPLSRFRQQDEQIGKQITDSKIAEATRH